jgi:hypothetical protein
MAAACGRAVSPIHLPDKRAYRTGEFAALGRCKAKVEIGNSGEYAKTLKPKLAKKKA